MIVANEKPSTNRFCRKWELGNDLVAETESYTHVGVLFQQNTNYAEITRECSSKLRKTFFSVINCGIFENGINPITAKHLYETVVLPKALYGCQLWSDLSREDINNLEVVHRFCVKVIQRLPKYSRTDIALHCLGVLPIEAEIDKKKLLFLCQLCHLDSSNIVKRLFVKRLCYYNNDAVRISGFFPDIYRICNKYELCEVLQTFCRTGVFPSKLQWKRLVKSHVKAKHLNDSRARIMADNSLQDSVIINPIIDMCPSVYWCLSKRERSMLPFSEAAVKLSNMLFTRPFIARCKRCDMLTNDIGLHIALYCKCTESARLHLWNKIYEMYGYQVFKHLISLPPKAQLVHLLSGLNQFLNMEMIESCLKTVGLFCFNLFRSGWRE